MQKLFVLSVSYFVSRETLQAGLFNSAKQETHMICRV